MSGRFIKSQRTAFIKAFIPVFTLLLAIFPINTDASVFSIFNTSAAASSPTAISSQKMKILEAPMSPDLSAVGGGDIITDESALIPDGAPLPLDTGVTPTTTAPSVVQQTQPDAGAISTYKVKQGDSISEISGKFGVSVNTILWANNMKKTDTIKVGETLVILPVTGVQYTIKRGDTIASIAKKFKGDAGEIASYNGLESGALVSGTKIIIPDGEQVQAPVKEKIVVAAPLIAQSVPPTPAPLAAALSVDAAPQTQNQNTGTDTTPDTQPAVPNSPSATDTSGDASIFIRPIAEGVGRKSQGLHGFNGIDIAAPKGTEIIAAQKGTVIVSRDSGYNGGYGKYVVIQHEGNVQTLYAHMTHAIAAVGATVQKGEVIGLVGSTGHSTGPHVHYEVRGAKNNCATSCN